MKSKIAVVVAAWMCCACGSATESASSTLASSRSELSATPYVSIEMPGAPASYMTTGGSPVLIDGDGSEAVAVYSGYASRKINSDGVPVGREHALGIVSNTNVPSRLKYSGGQYLLVTVDISVTPRSTVAIRLSSEGERLDATPLLLSANGVTATKMDVAPAPQGGWIVVWQEPTNSGDVYGAIIAADGTFTRAPGPLITGTGRQEAPAIATDGNSYLLTWSNDFDMRAARFDPQTWTVGTSSSIGSGLAGLTAIAPANGRFLVSFPQSSTYSGRLVDADGVPLAPLISFPINSTGRFAFPRFDGVRFVTAFRTSSSSATNAVTRMISLSGVLDGAGEVALPSSNGADGAALARRRGGLLLLTSTVSSQLGLRRIAVVDGTVRSLDDPPKSVARTPDFQFNPMMASSGTVVRSSFQSSVGYAWASVNDRGATVESSVTPLPTSSDPFNGWRPAWDGSSFLFSYFSTRTTFGSVFLARDVYVRQQDLSGAWVQAPVKVAPIAGEQNCYSYTQCYGTSCFQNTRCDTVGLSSSSAVMCGGGNCLVTWNAAVPTDADTSGNPTTYQIELRGVRVSPSLVPLDTSSLILSPRGVFDAAIAWDGSRYLVLSRTPGATSVSAVDGATGAVTAPQAVASTAGSNGRVGIAATSSGSALLLYSRQQAAGWDIVARSLSGTFTLGAEQVLATSASTTTSAPNVSAASDGAGFLAAYDFVPTTGALSDVRGASLDSAGGLKGAPFVISANTDTEALSAVVPLAGGRFMVGYARSLPGRSGQLRIRLISDGAANATACTTDSTCGSNSCIGGFCCDSACTGQCASCTVPGKLGQCVAVAGAPPAGKPACTAAGTSCGGVCDGLFADSCTFPGAEKSCGGSCASGSETVSRCDGAGACGAAVTASCSPFTCGPSACNDHCETAADCGVGNYCTSNFECATDSTPPTLTVPADIVLEATSGAGRAVTFSATATDDVSTSVAVSCSPASGATFALGTTIVSCTATDGVGNRATGAFNVTIHDTTNPTLLNMPSAQSAEATSSAGATVTWTGPTATDLVDASPDVSCTPSSGSTFALGPTTVTCAATDDSGNSASATFVVTVVDTTGPAFANVPAASTHEATSPAGAVVAFTPPTATDSVSGSSAVSCAPASGSTFAIGNTVVTCSASDTAGNSASATFTVTVADTTGPSLSGVPSNITTEATSGAGAVVTFSTPIATDIVDGVLSVSCVPNSGSLFALGTNTVTCTATDARGNSSSAGFTVTVEDTTPPQLTAPVVGHVEATSANGAALGYTVPTATDLVDAAPTVSCSPAPGSIQPFGAGSGTCTATDSAGNVATVTFNFEVSDTTAPQVSCPADFALEATSANGATGAWSDAVATDAASTPTVSYAPAEGTTLALGAQTITATATDDAGNSGSCTFVVTVADTTAPVITCPENVEAVATSDSGATVTFALPTVTDAVSSGIEPQLSRAPGSLFAIGDTTVTASATDGAGNSSSCNFQVRVTPLPGETTDGGIDGGSGGGSVEPGSDGVPTKGCGCGSAAGAPLLMLAGFSALLRRRNRRS